MIEADRHSFVARLAINRWLGRLEGIIVVDKQPVIVIMRPVQGLAHVEVKPLRLMDVLGGTTGPARMICDQVRSPIAFFHSQGHRLDNSVFLLAFDVLVPSQNPDDGFIPITLTDRTAIDAGVLDGKDSSFSTVQFPA